MHQMTELSLFYLLYFHTVISFMLLSFLIGIKSQTESEEQSEMSHKLRKDAHRYFATIDGDQFQDPEPEKIETFELYRCLGIKSPSTRTLKRHFAVNGIRGQQEIEPVDQKTIGRKELERTTINEFPGGQSEGYPYIPVTKVMVK